MDERCVHSDCRCLTDLLFLLLEDLALHLHFLSLLVLEVDLEGDVLLVLVLGQLVIEPIVDDAIFINLYL